MYVHVFVYNVLCDSMRESNNDFMKWIETFR